MHGALACRGSLSRLGVGSTGLYQMHWPGFLTQSWSNDAFVQGLATCAQKGLTQAVGVSNFREDRICRAASILEVSLPSQGGACGVDQAKNQPCTDCLGLQGDIACWNREEFRGDTLIS